MPAARTAESATLRALLRRGELRLRLEGGEGGLDDGALDRPVRWVHSSDLLDPTPFLADDLVLLTTGTQFPGDDQRVFAGYVARLRERGVLALGFGTEVVREGIPAGLVAACAHERMPLFEVPYRTPFIAVARANAEVVAAEAYARRSWALAAQRAVALAALRTDGLDATLAELAKRLDAWVGLYDAGGAMSHRHPAALPRESEAELAAEVATVLRRGASAGSALRIGGVPFTLQTLGRGGHLRGVLAVAGTDLDQESRAVITTVVAMAELSFAQQARLAHAVGRLRSALLDSLLAGDPALARRVSGELWGSLPEEPIEIAVAAEASDALIDELQQRGPATVAFFARDADGALVLAVAAGDRLPDELAAEHGLRFGVSAPTAYDAFARGAAQAREALRAGTGLVARFAEVAASGMLSAIDSDAARLRAAALLAPLRDHDAATDAQLEDTLRAWLAHDARFDAAAEALGVHRHTVRARVAQAARLLGVDLAGFPARADVWAALQLAR